VAENGTERQLFATATNGLPIGLSATELLKQKKSVGDLNHRLILHLFQLVVLLKSRADFGFSARPLPIKRYPLRAGYTGQQAQRQPR